MPNFNIIKKSEIDKTFRVSKLISEYDLKIEHSHENFKGNIEFPEKWNIGVIVGASGTGKTTIAKHLFSDLLIDNFEYTCKSVIDDMPKNKTMNEIEKAFFSVGFGSIPSWLKPYHVLSNGEKMRVDLARAILEKDFFVFDEFTSVVDRKIAQCASIAINKSVKKNNKKFIALSCHYDILEWLQPDWVFDTNEMKFVFTKAHDLKKNSTLGNVGETNGKNLASIII